MLWLYLASFACELDLDLPVGLLFDLPVGLPPVPFRNEGLALSVGEIIVMLPSLLGLGRLVFRGITLDVTGPDAA